MYHYVYKVKDAFENYYIGSRSSTLHPLKDHKYKGSMKTWKPDMSTLTKEIIKDDFLTREEAYSFETELISQLISDPLNKNYHIPNKGFCTFGYVTVKDKNGNIFNVKQIDERYTSGELIPIAKGTVVVKDINNNKFRVSLDDERYKSGELVHITKGRTGFIPVKDKQGNKLLVTKDDERYKSGELIHVTKGLISVKDSSGNTFSVQKNDPRYLNKELVSINKEKPCSLETKDKISKLAKERQMGAGNSFFGKIWVYNLELCVSKAINQDDLPFFIKEGWIKGRKLKF
jgi:hypothetical protein